MDIGSIDEIYEPKWYQVPGSDMEVEIKRLRPKERRKIVLEASGKKMSGRGTLTVGDTKKIEKEMLRLCITNWRYLNDGVDEEGKPKPVPCTQENKEFLSGNWTAFHDFWNSIVSDAEGYEDLELEEDRKN